MTFVKLIKDLTLSFGEIQRKNAAYNNFCMKTARKWQNRANINTEKKKLKLESGTNWKMLPFCQ